VCKDFRQKFYPQNGFGFMGLAEPRISFFEARTNFFL